jgi:hypothetical protein
VSGDYGVDTPAKCGVWLKATAQVALVHCHDEFAIHQPASILFIYGKLYHGDIIVLLNKYAGVHFSFADHIHGAQYVLNGEVGYSSPFSCITLGCCFLCHGDGDVFRNDV